MGKLRAGILYRSDDIRRGVLGGRTRRNKELHGHSLIDALAALEYEGYQNQLAKREIFRYIWMDQLSL